MQAIHQGLYFGWISINFRPLSKYIFYIFIKLINYSLCSKYWSLTGKIILGIFFVALVIIFCGLLDYKRSEEVIRVIMLYWLLLFFLKTLFWVKIILWFLYIYQNPVTIYCWIQIKSRHFNVHNTFISLSAFSSSHLEINVTNYSSYSFKLSKNLKISQI